MNYTTEKGVAKNLVSILLDKGYALRLCDEMEEIVGWTRNSSTILREMNGTGYDLVKGRLKADEQGRSHHVTFVLVWGNGRDGSELIADYYGGEQAEVIREEVYS